MDELSPHLGRAVCDWRALRRDTPIPKRADFDPLQFRYVLGMLSLLQVHRDPLRFRYRIHGTETARWVGFDLTGKFIDEGLNRDWAEKAHRHLWQVAATGKPSLERHFDQFIDHRTLNIEALVLPLSSDGVIPDYLISILIPHRRATTGLGPSTPHTEWVALQETA
jgi:hypothetical protein